MSNYIYFNDSTQWGRQLRDLLRTMGRGDSMFTDIRDVMVQMLNGDGSADAHYDEIAQRFGFDTTAAAHAAFLELDTCYGKTSGNGSVTNVRAARDQFFSRLRG